MQMASSAHIHHSEANASTYFNCSEELTNTNDTGRGGDWSRRRSCSLVWHTESAHIKLLVSGRLNEPHNTRPE